MNAGAATSPQQFNPKHRIVGAIVLVAVAVVFLPMVLDGGRGGSAGDPAIEIPEQDRKVFVSRIQPLEQGAEAAHDDSAAAPARPVSPPPVDPAQGEVEPVKPQAETAAPPARGSQVAAAKSEGWAVRIGTFANDANVERVTSALKKAGFKPNSDDIVVGGENATRVWVGPFTDKSAADKALARINKSTGEKGLVVAYPW
jgi:DedD protein